MGLVVKLKELRYFFRDLTFCFLVGDWEIIAVADSRKPATDIVRVDAEKYARARHSLDRFQKRLWDLKQKEQNGKFAFIEANELEIVSYGIKNSDAFKEFFAVGLPSSNAVNIITPNLAYFSDLPFADRFNELLKQLNGFSTAKAVVRLCKIGEESGTRFNGAEDPALEIMLGVLYGFENCCIRYYAEQGYFYHRVKPRWQPKDNFYGYVRCPSCRLNDVRPSWYNDDKKYRRYWWQLYLGIA